MPPKRGRPTTTDTTDPETLRRRQRDAERARQYRARRAAVSRQQTEEELDRAEAVAERVFTSEETTHTVQALGLRVQGMVLAQDASDAQFQQGAVPIDEHDDLYCNIELLAEAQPQDPLDPPPRSGTNLTRYFPTLPPRNPFTESSSDSPVYTIPPNISSDREEDEDESEEMLEDDGKENGTRPFLAATVEDGPEEMSEDESTIYDEHEAELHKHMEQAGDNHCGLGEVFHEPTFPSVLGLSDVISPERLAQQHTPSHTQWQAMFCGVPQRSHDRQQYPMNVCLHKEETRAVKPRVAFDVDSFLGFASSLAVARQGLWHQPAPQMRQNMTTDVHVETNVFEAGRSRLTMLKDIPHFLLGRVVGAHDITMHILFPHMASRDSKFTALTNDQLSRWLDQIFYPAVHRYCEADYTQHLPADFGHALANSKAHQIEGRQVETASYQSQQSIEYHLQSEYLETYGTRYCRVSSPHQDWVTSASHSYSFQPREPSYSSKQAHLVQQCLMPWKTFRATLIV
jgi:hypothetical protein